MIRLFTVKDQQDKQKAASSGRTGPRQSAGELRLQKDMSELNLDSNMTINFPEGKDKLLKFEVSIRMTEGPYKGGLFYFTFDVPTSYPHDAPKVKCKTKVYHPNIDVDGNICLNILREDWKPVLSIDSIVYGLKYILLEPNPEDPLNKEAAEMQVSNPEGFNRLVAQMVARGGSADGAYFPACKG